LLPQGIVDAVGYGDGVSFGLTDWVRDKLDTNSVVNKDSFTYKATFIAGVATPIGGGLSQVPQVKRGADYANLMWKYRTLETERLALRREIATREPTKGHFHIQKGEDDSKFFSRLVE